MTITPIAAGVMAIMVAIAVYTDVRQGKIFNGLTLPCAIAGIIINAAYGGLEGVFDSLLGMAVGFGMFLFSALFGRILGGGDVKLLMAIGAIQGPQFLFWTIIYMAIIGGALAIGISLWRKDLLASLRRLFGGLSMRLFAGTRVDIAETKAVARLPYAIPIALGSLTAVYVLQFAQILG